jgi:hypothetical protein
MGSVQIERILMSATVNEGRPQCSRDLEAAASVSGRWAHALGRAAGRAAD